MGAERETKQDTDEAEGFVVAEGWRVCWVKRAAAPEVQEVVSKYILWAWRHSFVAFHLIFVLSWDFCVWCLAGLVFLVRDY